MLTRQQKKKLTTVLKFVVPLVLVSVVVSVGITFYTVEHIIKPPRTSTSATIEDYKLLGILITQTEESWTLKNGGGSGSGWLLRAGTGAPAVILSHGYGQNKSDLLSLGVSLNRAGFHVLLYDLRAHGENKASFCSMGEYEGEDLLAAIEHLKSLKDIDGNPLVDQQRIGLYGVSVGAFASMIAASKDQSVKAIVVDAIYTDTQKGVHLRLKEATGLNNSLMEYLVDKGVSFYASTYPSKSAVKAARGLTEAKQLYVLGKDAGELLTTTGEVYNQAMGYKETVEVPHSRIKILYKNDQDVYDPVVVDFFRRADVLSPLPPPTPTAPAGNETTPKK